ncbi:MAG: hydantoinase/oxoprolinase family protein [Gemmataceae bacterium]
MASVLGLDIGGANLKAAHSRGGAVSVPFALWRHPSHLTDALKSLAASLPSFDVLAITMTGELCDCWEDNVQGVRAILDSAKALASGRDVRVWTQEGRLVSLAEAERDPGKAASANWLALATLAARQAHDRFALLIDVGSTTTDLIPLVEGRPAPRGRTDPTRLASGELVYRGWKRTPLCALTGPGRAAELFATMHDVCLLRGLVAEDASDRDTADGRPATIPDAHRRMARMLCADLASSSGEDRLALAEEVFARFCSDIREGITRALAPWNREPDTLLLAGSGEFLLPDILRICGLDGPSRRRISLREKLGPDTSTAACAHAVAVLAAEGAS